MDIGTYFFFFSFKMCSSFKFRPSLIFILCSFIISGFVQLFKIANSALPITKSNSPIFPKLEINVSLFSHISFDNNSLTFSSSISILQFIFSISYFCFFCSGVSFIAKTTEVTSCSISSSSSNRLARFTSATLLFKATNSNFADK